MPDVGTKVLEIIGGGGIPGPLTRASTIKELEIDSLEFVEIVFDLEDAFGIHIELEAGDLERRFQTLDDIIRAVEVELAKARSAS